MARRKGQTTRRTRTARDIPRLPVGLHRFDPTLYLKVVPSGARSWVQRIVLPDGRQVDRGLGGWPVVKLEDARLEALSNRRTIRAGRDPFAERRREPAPTFAAAADATLAANRDGWAPSSVKAWLATMRNHVLPRLGNVRIAALTRQHVIDCLKAITSTAEARKAKMRIRQTCEYAVSREWAPENVCVTGNGIDAALPHLKRQDSTHQAAAPYAAVGAILRRLSGIGSAAADAVAFVILTGARSAEATDAEWVEVDLDARVWTVPAERMKARKAHRVPLSAAAVAILARRRGRHDRYVFASDRPGKAATVTAEGLRRLVRPDGVTVHGFRSSFCDWAGEVAKVDDTLAQTSIAHTRGNATEQAYARGDLLDRRRELMDAWATYLDG